MNKLAIVIPAYKINYFDQAMASIADQTNKDFTVYVGDDASPSPIFDVVKKYEDRLTIIYKRFDKNLGGTDLVGQWNRCLDMVEREEWLWLFSDDDIMEPNCVEAFYEAVTDNPAASLWHFNVKVIDGNGGPKETLPSFPDLLSSGDFYRMRISGEIYSFVVEYIFKRELYVKNGKFESFDLGWNSDDATWIKFGLENGIRTIGAAKVHWRFSDHNISADNRNSVTVKRKVSASVDFLLWVEKFFDQYAIRSNVGAFQKVKMKLLTSIAFSSIAFPEKRRLAMEALDRLSLKRLKPLTFIYLIYILTKKSIMK